MWPLGGSKLDSLVLDQSRLVVMCLSPTTSDLTCSANMDNKSDSESRLLTVILFIYGSFNDTVSSSDYVALNDRMIRKQM
jgi:hypothetical protein